MALTETKTRTTVTLAVRISVTADERDLDADVRQLHAHCQLVAENLCHNAGEAWSPDIMIDLTTTGRVETRGLEPF